jgi:hypothetical protein
MLLEKKAQRRANFGDSRRLCTLSIDTSSPSGGFAMGENTVLTLSFGVRERTPDNPLLRQTRAHLEDLVLRLEVLRSAVSICASALRHQNCEIDEDVACVLQRNVGDRLGEEIDRTNQLLLDLEQEPD